jgi:hypothetical protein
MDSTPAVVKLPDGRIALIYSDGTMLVIGRHGSVEMRSPG